MKFKNNKFRVLILLMMLILFITGCSDAPTSGETSFKTTGSINGTILDEEGDGISAVSISVSDSNATTSSNGSFTIRDLETGSYVLTAEKEGYKTIRKDIVVEDGSNSLRLEMKEATSESETYKIKVNIIESQGSVDINPDKESYNEGEEIKLTVEPKEGWEFVEWSGDLEGVEKTIETTVTSDMEITAKFEIKTDKLDISINGEGSYEITPIQDEYEYGDEIIITSKPAEGWEFESWSGDIESTDNPVNATIKGGEIEVASTEDNLNITANFERKTFSVTTSVEGEGSITPNLDNEIYDYNDTITLLELTATPNEGYHLAEWQGIDKDTNETIEVEVTDDLDITAIFGVNTYDVVFKDYDGSILKDKTVNHGDSASAPSEPKRKGYNFIGWDTDFDSVTEDLTITANYEIKTDNLDISINGEGSYEITPIQDEYEYGDEITITAKPAEGWEFESWSGDIESTDNPVNATIKGGEIEATSIEEALSINANFERKTFSVTTNAIGEGEIDPDIYIEDYKYGDLIEITAIPNEGYHLARWEGVDKEANEKIEVEITSNSLIEAIFEINTYEVAFKDHEGVIETQTIEHGNGASAPSQPTKENYDFVGWDTEFDNVTEDLIVKAIFEINTYEVAFKDHKGVIETQTIEHGNGASAPSQPTKENYDFVGWDTEFDNVTEDLIVKAIFEINTYEVAFKDHKGVIETQTIEHGNGASAPQPSTKEGHYFVNWDTEFDNVTEDLVVEAIFESRFTFDSNTGAIEDYYAGEEYDYEFEGLDVYIPYEIDGVKVEKISNGAFENKNLYSVWIPHSVTEIGNKAFENNNLRSVDIPDSVTEIGDRAFANNDLSSIYIYSYSNLTEIGEWAFAYNNLSSLEIPDHITEIGDYAFSNNELTSLEIPDHITEIGDYAFSNNELTSLQIPDSITKISKGVFAYNKLSSIEIPNHITEIGSGAFTFYYSFTRRDIVKIKLPDNINFEGDSSLKDIYEEHDKKAGTYYREFIDHHGGYYSSWKKQD